MKKFWIIPFLLTGCNLVIPEVPPDSHVQAALDNMYLHERKDNEELQEYLDIDPARTEWCAAFVNAVLHQKGIPGSESVSDYPLMAKSFLRWGESVDEPLLGDVVIFPRGNQGWQGHVGFYTMSSADGKYYYILGGNQNDRVTIEMYPASLALDIRRSSKFRTHQTQNYGSAD